MRNCITEIWDSIKLMWELDRIVLIVTVIKAIIQAFPPFCGILLSAYILDGLTLGLDVSTLLWTTVFGVSGIFLLTIVNVYLDNITNVHTEICVRKFGLKKCERTLTMDYELLDSPKVHEILSRINLDNQWGAGFYSMIFGLPLLVRSIITFLTSMVILIPMFFKNTSFYSVWMLVFFSFLALIVLISGLFQTKVNTKIQVFLAEIGAKPNFYDYFVFRSLNNFKTGKDIRIYNAKELIKTYCEKDRTKQYIGKMTKSNAAIGFASGLSSGLFMTISYLFVVIRAVYGGFSIGAIVKYASTLYQFATALHNMMIIFDEYAKAAHRQESTMDYMDVSDVLYKGTLPVEKRDDNEYEFAFHNVSFKYPGGTDYVLKNVSISFRIGQRLAVVGMNGSGKTTLIKLLCRLYDPTDGEITLNGIDIKKYRYEEYVRIFSVVFQDFQLFSFPLGQNIAASVTVNQQKAEECLKRVGFWSRFTTMPQGLDTPLYKNFESDGVEISGGEAQKIALARALYKDAPFIILDEPTAALDPVAEYEIYTKFNEIVGDKTAIYISHRLSSCRFCDHIVVFDNGRIVQQGSHDALLREEGGKYQELWHAQAQYYV